MARLGLDYAVLREANPGLIYCSLSGYGASGPLLQEAGHDSNYLAASGVLHRNGQTMPYAADPPLADVSGSLFGVIAILGALRARDADGSGCAIDIGLADTPMPLQMFPIAEYGLNGTVPQRNETYLNGGAAYYHVYATRDGRHVALGAVEPKFWAAFCNAVGRPEWAARQSEKLPQHRLIADVAERLGAMTMDECAARIGPANCCFSPILDLGEALASPQHQGRGIVRKTPDGFLQALFPAKVDGLPPATRPKLREGEQAPKHQKP
jgi:crotonobetainyl-CoA:carnitine CoA-transferase CaiB-like acyl-CoA transferase